MRKTLCFLLAAMLATFGWGCGDDDYVPEFRDGGVTRDSSVAPDAGRDASVDGRVVDTGTDDAGVRDTGTDDAGTCACEDDETCIDDVCVARAVALAAGAEHSCALRADGTVMCWGRNAEGQLGLGTTGSPTPTPTLVPELTDVTQVVAGANSTCALLEDGTARCWGSNIVGQLGDGTFDNRSSPTAVMGLSDAVRLGPGPLHNCAILETGGAQCWGWNGEGELGIGMSGDDQFYPTPQTVMNLADAVQIQGGYQFTCALVEDGEMYCWGRNLYGNLGDGTEERRTTPVQVQTLDDVTQFAPGGGHVCAVREGGEVWCWGDGTYGQLAQGANDASSSTPISTSVTNATQVSATNPSACALLNDGTVRCWGGTPTAVSGLSNAVAISLAYGDAHVCALRADHSVVCWGRNQSGQLGNGEVEDATIESPVTVVGL